MTYNAKLVPMEYSDFIPVNTIIQFFDGSVILAKREYPIFESDRVPGQRLVITDETPYQDIKGGYVLCPDRVSVVNVIGYEADLKKYWCVVSGAKCLIDGSDYKKVIATYPTLPDVPQIDLADVRKWIESGCKESVDLYADILDGCLVVHNNTVKMVWGEQDKAQPIAGEFISASCIGELCSVCGSPATKKIGEEIFHDDPNPIRHNLTAYVCNNHFNMVLNRRQHHPATDWHDLANKYYKQDVPNMTAEAIFNFFKNELTK